MDVNKQLGKRIKYLRSLVKWSQEDLALEAGINKNYLSDLERGERNPTVKVLEKIAKAFGISLEELFKGIQTFQDAFFIKKAIIFEKICDFIVKNYEYSINYMRKQKEDIITCQ